MKFIDCSVMECIPAVLPKCEAIFPPGEQTMASATTVLNKSSSSGTTQLHQRAQQRGRPGVLYHASRAAGEPMLRVSGALR